MAATERLMQAAGAMGQDMDQRGDLRAFGRLRAVPAQGPGPLVDCDSDAAGQAVRVPVFEAWAEPNVVAERGAVTLHQTHAGVPSPFRSSLAIALKHDAVPMADQSGFTSTPFRRPVAEPCQRAVDIKAFTGKGEPLALRTATKNVDAIHSRMRELALASVALGKNQLYLTLHARQDTGQFSLRWRGYVVVDGRGGHKHLAWDSAASRIAAMTYVVRMQMQIWDAEARRLNEAERAARLTLKRARRVTQ
jgi:hypothetical protein